MAPLVRILLPLGLLLSANVAAALELQLPLACTPGHDCLIVRYVDHDAGADFADYRCGALGSDGHKGTDFALRSPRQMTAGVDVLAAASGSVVGTRDGMPNQPEDGSRGYDYGNRNCGNGVTVRHEQGWETQYCHLAPGSVAVRTGDAVSAGQRLGQVGMSGESNFPHVHLSVRQEGVEVDPFTSEGMDAPCGPAGATLWAAEVAERLAYRPVAIAGVGLTDHVPDHRAIVADRASAPLSGDRPLVGYILGYGGRAGDRIDITISAPDGSRVSELSFPVEEDAPRFSRSGGRRAPAGGWPAGAYRIEASVVRGEQRWTEQATVTLDR
ncbi:M23 family metallopeptidase [Marinivivus vitaminiproducens]|uniref:M23 family metallopeptidase n=1 Tax=Marinivivus vitaminiproducens TaxID=3035935 RepID=UPI002799ABDE|nr:M23 family metallopeptidase [Geminicoccaceae bacterium SCSIO 64248]